MTPFTAALYGTAVQMQRRLLRELTAGDAPAALADLRSWITDEDQAAADLLEAVAGRLHRDAVTRVYEVPPGLVVSIPIAPDQTLPVTVHAAWRSAGGHELPLCFRLERLPPARNGDLRAAYQVDEA